MFGFAWVWLLVLLPLPFLIRSILPSDTHEGDGALRVPFFEDIAKLSNRKILSAGSNKTLRLLFLFMIWVFLVLAIARPEYAGTAQPVMDRARNMMLAVDISGSMDEKDFVLEGKQLNRISVVKKVASDFLKMRQGDKIGVVAFGTRSYLYVPITADVKTASDMLLELEVGFAGPLTAIGDALGLALKSMQEIPAESRVIILLSDGSANAGAINVEQAIKAAKAMGVKIYTIGVGAYEKEVQGMFGTQIVNPSTDLDEEALQKIAKETGGEYFRAYDTKELQKIYGKIDALEPVEAGETFVRPVKELFYIPLGIALFLSVLGAFLFMQGARRLW